jgi:DNA polymerase-3 subunit delta
VITILTGSNSFGIRAELKRLVEAFVSEHDDMALERLDGEEAEYARMQEAMQSLPFLASRKMVVLQSPGANKQFAENAEKLLAELPETTDLVIVEPKLDKRSVYYKLLKKQKGFQEFAELDERGLSKWLVEQAKEKGATLSPVDALYLIGRVGTNQQKLASEIEKLSLYQSTINRNVIDELTAATPQSTIFQLLEAAFAGNTRRALALYGEQRALKVEPQQIIAMLAWQLHVLALIKTAKDITPDEIARDAKISPYVVRKSAGIARNLTLAQTKRLIGDLLTIDQRLKSESLNADDVLLNYLMTISQ